MGTELIREGKLMRQEIDVISEKLNEILDQSDEDRQTRLRIRLTLEDMILDVCENLGEKTHYTLTSGKIFGRQFIRFTYQGLPFEPGRNGEDPSDNWSSRIMSDMGLKPAWQYQNGVNSLELKLKRKRLGNMQAILLALVLAIVCGFAGGAVLPASVKDVCSELFFKPMQSTFLRLMSTFAGFMILFSVSCGIFNMGNISSFSRIGKVMFRRFIGFTVLLGVFVSVICYFLFPTMKEAGSSLGFDQEGLSKILQMIYDIVPGDPVTPFHSGNAMQIVFLGIIIGISIMLMGDKASGIKTVTEELNTLVNNILSGICKLLPFYIFFILINMIWSDTFKNLVNVWKPFVTMVLIDGLLLFVMIIYISFKYKVSAVILIKKMIPSMVICITTASTISAFNQTVDDCIDKFGIDKKYMKVVHPIKCIIYMPGVVNMLIVLVFSMAQFYKVKTSLSWIIFGILIASILTIAVPPIPGAMTMIFSIIFSQMHIPTEAMAFAVACDVFYDFLDTAINNSVGILEYILQADKLDMLDTEILRRECE